MKPEALRGLAGLGTRPDRTFTLQPGNSEPTLTANGSLKANHRFEVTYEEHQCAGEQISDTRIRAPDTLVRVYSYNDCAMGLSLSMLLAATIKFYSATVAGRLPPAPLRLAAVGLPLSITNS